MQTIDMHSHIIPKGLADALRARTKPPMIMRGEDGKEYMNSLLNSRGELAPGFDSVEKRLEEMAKDGVTHAVLSNALQDISSLPLEDAIALCRAYNDAISAACVKYPDRLHAFAAIPVGSVEAAVAEFDRAMSLPGLVGAIIPGDAFLSAKRAEKFAPLLESPTGTAPSCWRITAGSRTISRRRSPIFPTIAACASARSTCRRASPPTC